MLPEPHDLRVADALAVQVLDERKEGRPRLADCDPVGTEPDLVALDHGGSIVGLVPRVRILTMGHAASGDRLAAR